MILRSGQKHPPLRCAQPQTRKPTPETRPCNVGPPARKHDRRRPAAPVRFSLELTAFTRRPYCDGPFLHHQVSIFKRTSFVSRSRYSQLSTLLAHSQLTDLSSHADSKCPLQPAQGVSNNPQQLSWAVPSFMFSVVRPDRYHLRPTFSKTPFKVSWRTVAATPLHARSTAFAPRQSIPFSQVAHLRRMRPVGASLLRQGGLLITAPRCSDRGACSSRRLAAQTGGLLLR